MVAFPHKQCSPAEGAQHNSERITPAWESVEAPLITFPKQEARAHHEQVLEESTQRDQGRMLAAGAVDAVQPAPEAPVQRQEHAAAI